jgi:hypothetical protein
MLQKIGQIRAYTRIFDCLAVCMPRFPFFNRALCFIPSTILPLDPSHESLQKEIKNARDTYKKSILLCPKP